MQDDRSVHGSSLGTIVRTSPICGAPRTMTCSMFAEGPFGLQNRRRLLCSDRGSRWVIDTVDEPKILASIKTERRREDRAGTCPGQDGHGSAGSIPGKWYS